MNPMSQIPLVVLKRVELGKLQNRSVTFADQKKSGKNFDTIDDIDSDKDTDANSDKDIDAENIENFDAHNESAEKDTDSDKEVEIIKKVSVTKLETKETADAFVQTDQEPRRSASSIGVQTDISFMPNEIDYDQFRAYLETKSLSHYKPMYSLSKSDGKRPPLKLGLTLPKGKKRRVFYPDLENA